MRILQSIKNKTLSKQKLMILASIPAIAILSVGSYYTAQYTTKKSLNSSESLVPSAYVAKSEGADVLDGAALEKAKFKSMMMQNGQPPGLKLKMEKNLASLDFKKGQIELTVGAKETLKSQIEQFNANVNKVHVKGFSGNLTIAYSVRKGLAFERAYAVKQFLVENGVEPSKVRLFYFAQDHAGQPRADINWLMTGDEAQEDAKIALKK